MQLAYDNEALRLRKYSLRNYQKGVCDEVLRNVFLDSKKRRYKNEVLRNVILDSKKRRSKNEVLRTLS